LEAFFLLHVDVVTGTQNSILGCLLVHDVRVVIETTEGLGEVLGLVKLFLIVVSTIFKARD
jgi:hypothetical protein